ncbi:hypothetical protein HYC85_012338 [Camellia sinensis]|uniref:Glucosidase II beta subunit N-terminal domain-containing protein n=1 Tax=Camellia sinensis TaxID=4442 RepID=A0A7J7HCL2_CAMSI|nr:hypothetical protein HYC85_012338 [Camellia sinensis]
MEGSLGVGVLGGYCCCIFLFLFLFFTTCSASFLPIGIHPLDDKYYASEVIKCKDGSKSLTRDRINDDFCDCLDGTDEPEAEKEKRMEEEEGGRRRRRRRSGLEGAITVGGGGGGAGGDDGAAATIGAGRRARRRRRRAGRSAATCWATISSIFPSSSLFLSLSLRAVAKNVSLSNGTPQFLFSSRVNDQFCDCCDGSDEYDGSIICFNTCVMGGNVGYETINYKSTTAVDDVKVTEKGIISEDSTQKFKGLKIFIILQAILISFVVAFGLFRRRGKLRRRHIHRPSLT